ncbi:hypothetical protein D9613_010432 [Agrocybe pediades]|uniref:Uncharacterized protein n=1 Tax=Agrocybe pediades TaxID=84607 RepID=A0A8H4VHW5_9AGAR|nr:hypothetical protein D9613_010432 [Agrocybe pediades]
MRLKSVYEKCLPIIQLSKPLETKWEKMKRTMRLWRDQQELEMSVHNLRDQAKKCRRRFKMRTQLGTVAAVIELKTVVVKARHMGHDRPQIGSENSELNLRGFVGPASSHLSTLPPEVVLSEDVVYKLHVRIHIRKLDSVFKALASRQVYPIEEPDRLHSSSMELVLAMQPFRPESVDHLQGDIMINIIRTQQELNAHNDGVSIQRGALAAKSISVALDQLGMYEEAITLGHWTVDLYKTLTSQSNRQDAYAPRLSLALFNLSMEFDHFDDRVQSRTLISECLAVLRSCTPTFGVEILMADAFSYSAYSCGLGLNHLDTLPKLQDAVARFARLLSGAHHHGVQDTFASSVSLQGHDIYMEPQDLNLYHYAEALRRLCLCLCVAGSYREALGPGLKALELFRVLASRYRRHHMIRKDIAYLCLALCEERSNLAFLPAQAFAYAEESIQNWEIASSTTAIDSDDLIDSFMKKTEILIDLERFNDAFKAFQNAAGVTRSMDTYQWTHLETLQEVSSRFYSIGKYYLAEQTSKVVVDLCRQYVRRLPSQQNSFVLVVLKHTRNCKAANHLSEGAAHMREVLDSAESQNVLNDIVLASNYLRCYSWIAYLLIEQGLPDDAPVQCEKAIRMFSPPTSKQTACDILDAITSKMRSLLALGRLFLALGVAGEGQSFAALHGLQETTEYAFLCYHISLMHRRAGESLAINLNLSESLGFGGQLLP